MEKEVVRGEARKSESVWIAAPFEMLGDCRDAHGGGWARCCNGATKMGASTFNRSRMRRCMASRRRYAPTSPTIGLRIARARQRDFVGYLLAARSSGACGLSRERAGMKSGAIGFRPSGQTIGPAGGEHVILDAAAHGPYEARGTVEDWRDGAARLASSHLLPVLAISAALAGPLLRLAGIEGGGLHVFGQSSKGKTTLLHMAASVWGRGDGGGYVRTWRATANGLEGAAAGATDTALILDEVGQVDAREMGAALYALANGTGKARAERDGGLREPKTWRVLAISSGEFPIETKLAEDRGRKLELANLCVCLTFQRNARHGVSIIRGRTATRRAWRRRSSWRRLRPMGRRGRNSFAG